MLFEIPLWEIYISVVLIYCDSIKAIAKIKNHYHNGKIHQIRRKHNIVIDIISKGAVRVDHVHTNKNLTYPFTKGLARDKVHNTSNRMELIPIENRVAHNGNQPKRLEIPRIRFNR